VIHFGFPPTKQQISPCPAAKATELAWQSEKKSCVLAEGNLGVALEENGAFVIQ
jgi:hypothetical protein